MAKPIFLVGIPREIATIKEVEFYQKKFENHFEQYYVLVYLCKSNDIDFKCFYEKDFDEIKFEELKQIVRDGFADKEIKETP